MIAIEVGNLGWEFSGLALAVIGWFGIQMAFKKAMEYRRQRDQKMRNAALHLRRCTIEFTPVVTITIEGEDWPFGSERPPNQLWIFEANPTGRMMEFVVIEVQSISDPEAPTGEHAWWRAVDKETFFRSHLVTKVVP
jgi:hypothetical protein